MNRIMARSAHPKRAGNHVLPAEQLQKTPFTVEATGNEVVTGEHGHGPPAKLTGIGLGW